MTDEDILALIDPSQIPLESFLDIAEFDETAYGPPPVDPVGVLDADGLAIFAVLPRDP